MPVPIMSAPMHPSQCMVASRIYSKHLAIASTPQLQPKRDILQWFKLPMLQASPAIPKSPEACMLCQ